MLEIIMWCNREVESNVWHCETHIALMLPCTFSAESGERIREACVKFHSRNRKHLFVIPRSEVAPDQQKFEISFEIHNVVGYR
ncbi:hypothetical protein TELCIR_18555 [Teladorsagia circumcincta]|uniref:Uncharacterized protein n=1 Tax=Teladorsagia circumcincta TaxID=45464 RepID=A0A2G9TPV2_TELCI|nr:hypothetical protein TELCIR_18555 [Teladorsagia circumcincta]